MRLSEQVWLRVYDLSRNPVGAMLHRGRIRQASAGMSGAASSKIQLCLPEVCRSEVMGMHLGVGVGGRREPAGRKRIISALVSPPSRRETEVQGQGF